MANRSPTEFHFRWPDITNVADLPNVAGSPMQSPKLAVGDLCYDALTDTYYFCTAATLGAATWSPLTSSTDRYAPRIIVGNALAGDTADVCTILDPGDGSGIAAALGAAGALNPILNPPGTPASEYVGVDVYVRPGRYTRPAGAFQLFVPGNTRLHGAGPEQTLIVAPSGQGGLAPWRTLRTVDPYATIENLGFAVPAIDPTSTDDGRCYGIIEAWNHHTTVRNVRLVPDNEVTIEPVTATIRSFVAVVADDPASVLVEEVEVDFWTNVPLYAGPGLLIYGVTFGFDTFLFNTVMPTGQQPIVRDVYVAGTYETGVIRFDGVGATRISYLTIENVTCLGVVAAVSVFCRASTQQVFTLGPTIRNVHAVYAGGINEPGVGGGGVFVTMVDDGFTCDMTNVVLEEIDGVCPDFAHVGPAQHPQVNAYNDNCTMRNVRITNMQYSDPSGSVVNCEINSIGSGTMHEVLVYGVRVLRTAGAINIGSATNTVRNPMLTNCFHTDLNIGALVTNAQVLANRLTGVYTDLGVGTTNSINIIAP